MSHFISSIFRVIDFEIPAWALSKVYLVDLYFMCARACMHMRARACNSR